MPANRNSHRGGVIIIATLVACILTAARTWADESRSQERPGERPQATGGISTKPATEADDLALILQRLKTQFTTINPNMGRMFNSSRAPEWLASLADDGHWPDIDYAPHPPMTPNEYGNPTTANRHSNAHLIRLAMMTLAYANPAGPDYHSAQMLDGIQRGLRHWLQGHPLSDNWWDNTIGEPLLLSRTLVPLEDVLPADILRQAVSYFVSPTEKDASYSRASLSYPQQQLIRGALLRSAEDVTAASDEMQRIIRIRVDEGIQRDFSFHQHGPQLYNGGYGLTFIVDIINYATLLRGTRFAFAHDKLTMLADHLLEGDAYMIRGKALDYSAFGRTLLRRGGGESAPELVPLCDQLAVMLPERAAELTALKAHIEGTGLPYSFLGNRYFWNSDFMTHQREAYYISVKMVSDRTVGTESIHGENTKGCWLPFGATWILRRGDEYNSILRVLDWGRLPGVTSPHATLKPVRNVRQPEEFVGGVSDGTYGAATMEFAQTEPLPITPRVAINAQGRKAWFFFDREMVALGAGINSSRDDAIGTTLNQTRLNGPALIDGHEIEPGEVNWQPSSWVLHDEVGYALLGPAAAIVKVGTQTGEAMRMGPQTGDSTKAAPPQTGDATKAPPQTGDSKSSAGGRSYGPVTESVFSLWIDHGVHPKDAQYAYAVLPGTDARQLAEWVAHRPVRVLANTPAQQAVIHDQLGVAEIVFHAPGSVKLAEGTVVTVDHRCLALLSKQLSKQGKSTRIAVSSPGGEFFSVHLSLKTPQKEQNATFDLPSGDMAGKSQILEIPITW